MFAASLSKWPKCVQANQRGRRSHGTWQSLIRALVLGGPSGSRGSQADIQLPVMSKRSLSRLVTGWHADPLRGGQTPGGTTDG